MAQPAAKKAKMVGGDRDKEEADSNDGINALISSSATPPPPAGAFVGVGAPATPRDVEVLVLSYLDPKSLLRVRETCGYCSTLASDDVLWRPLLTQSELFDDSRGGCMGTYRAMRVPPPPLSNDTIVCCSGAIDGVRPPRPPSDPTLRGALRTSETVAEALAEYRILVEVTHVDGTRVLSQVVRPFPGMLNWQDRVGLDHFIGDDPGVIAVRSGCAEPFPTPPVPPRNEWEEDGEPLDWQREAFGREGTKPIIRLVGRLCIEHRGTVVTLKTVAVADSEYVAPSDDPKDDAALVFFRFHLPVLALPEALVSELRDFRVFFESVVPTLYVRVKPTSASRDAWLATSLVLEMDPYAERLSPTKCIFLPRDEDTYDIWDYYSESSEPLHKTDEMMLCCLSEAIEASRREVAEYLHPNTGASELDRDLLRAVTNRDWVGMRNLRSSGANFTAAIKCGDYPDMGCCSNLGMMPLHFAVRDHSPLAVIKEIYEAFPCALHLPEGTGLTPIQLLERTSPNPPSYSEKGYSAVKAYLEGLLSPNQQD